MPEAIQHVRELADRIGPRPATTDAEAEAANYIEDCFRSRGLEVERQEFECPRTYSWAFVIYHVLTVLSAGVLFWADAWGPLRWIAFAVAAFVAVTMWFDLDTRGGLSSVMPKGPSQNVIARRVPKARRGERLRKVVIVAHYDSAKASLAFAPAMVKNFTATFELMKWCTFLVPVLMFLDNLPLTSAADPYLWYLTLAVAAYLLIPALINTHRELAMRAVDGANDNASGVAAMLAAMEAIVPEPEGGIQMPTQPFSPVGSTRATDRGIPPSEQNVKVIPRDQLPAVESDVDTWAEGEDVLPVETAPAGLPDDFQWAETAPVRESERPRQASLDFGTVEFEPVGSTRERRPEPDWDEGAASTELDLDESPAEEGLSVPPSSGRGESPIPAGESPDRSGSRTRKGGLFGLGRKRKESADADVSGWLGVDKGFDARKAGKDIGNWENFDDDDDDFGVLGGWAGDDPIGDPDFAANEASRIRKRVTDRIDYSIDDKEVWFVATGAEEAGTWGMRAFLGQYASELKGAFIINLDNLGTGALYWVTREGMARRYRSDRRLVNMARQVSREHQIVAKGREYRGLSTDATPALARKYRAMSIMAFDINGRLPNWHWYTDTTGEVQPENLEQAARFVTEIVREL